MEDKDTKRESADSDGSESESDDDADVSKVLLPSQMVKIKFFLQNLWLKLSPDCCPDNSFSSCVSMFVILCFIL